MKRMTKRRRTRAYDAFMNMLDLARLGQQVVAFVEAYHRNGRRPVAPSRRGPRISQRRPRKAKESKALR